MRIPTEERNEIELSLMPFLSQNTNNELMYTQIHYALILHHATISITLSKQEIFFYSGARAGAGAVHLCGRLLFQRQFTSS